MVHGSGAIVKCKCQGQGLGQVSVEYGDVRRGWFMDRKAVKPLNGRCKGSVEHKVKMP